MRALTLILTCCSTLVWGQNINRLEYYFDVDPGFGNGISVPVTAAPDLTRDFFIPLNTVSEGFHRLYVRARSNGNWSLPYARPVWVQRNAQSTTPVPLRRVEFFIDTDPGYGNGTQLPATTTAIDQLVVLDLTALPGGFHILHIRSQDENGRWSQPYSKPFFAETAGADIVAIEYYFDDGTTASATRRFASFTPGKDITLDFAASLAGLLPNTTYTIRLTAINADGQRSKEVAHVFTTPAFICDPLPAPTATGASRCESGVVTLTASGATGTQAYHWYATATDPTPIAGGSGNSFTTPVLTSTTSFYVSLVNGTCESSRTEVVATILNCNQPPVFTATQLTIAANTTNTIDIAPLLSDPDNNLDLSSLKILTPTAEAIAGLNGTWLTLDYHNTDFVGTEAIVLEVCDVLGSCTQQSIAINVVGELEIYNALSPNGDLKNEIFYIRYIDVLPDTQENEVFIFNRWGDLVFRVQNYDNQDRVFRGYSNNGNALPGGTYFYKIEFADRPPHSGFLTLKR